MYTMYLNVIEAINSEKVRSAWSRGVKAYARELLADIDGDICEGLSRDGLLEMCLNGASSWSEYSYGGCALVYDSDIAERLCTPSELKRCKGGDRPPRAGVEWLDVQARALRQAFGYIWRAYTRVETAIENGRRTARCFYDYLEAVEGISWECFDNNYSGTMASEIYDRYDYYVTHQNEYADAFAKYDALDEGR